LQTDYGSPALGGNNSSIKLINDKERFMTRKGLFKRITGIRISVAIQVFSTMLVLALGYFAIERNLKSMTRSMKPIPVYELKATTQKIRVQILFVAFVAFVAGMGLAYTITRQIRQFSKGLESLATGDIRTDLSLTPANDFLPLDSAIRKLTDSLNHFLRHSITDAIILLNHEGVIYEFNPTAEYLFGYKADEVAGNHISSIFPKDERNQALYDSIFSPHMERGGLRDQISGTIISRIGEAISVRVSSFRLGQEKSRSFGLVVGMLDVREFRKLKEEIDRADRLSSLGMLVAGLAHEIKNPLGAIKGLVQLLSEDVSKDDPKSNYYATILNEVEQLDSVLRRLLDFAHPKESVPLPIELEPLIEDILALMKTDLEEKAIRLDMRLASDPITLTGDGEGLRQALINILKNAVEATPEQGTISVVTGFMKDEVLICFENEGPPISKDEMGLIFDPFYTTKEKGAGLGLAITHQIIRAHNGRIRVDDREGKGAAFEIRIPIKTPSV
jgi:two-component system sensor histidine kinase AtoS